MLLVQEVGMLKSLCGKSCWFFCLIGIVATTLLGVFTPEPAYAQRNQGAEVETRVYSDVTEMPNYQAASD